MGARLPIILVMTAISRSKWPAPWKHDRTKS